MTTLTLTLDPVTADWLNREAAAAAAAPADVAARLLRELADPDGVENALIDRLLAEAAHSFPPVMELDEQAEMRDEVIDGLCHRLAEAHRSHLGVPMTAGELVAFRTRFEDRSRDIWG